MRERIHTSKGILDPKAAATKFRISRYAPAAELACFIQRYWIVRWDVGAGGPYEQELLSHPCVNLVLERGRSGIFGVTPGRSARLLEGEGVAFGIKFRPGGFYPFVRFPLVHLTGRMMALREAFGEAGERLEATVLAHEDDEAMIEVAEAFLRERAPACDERLLRLHAIVAAILSDPTIAKVDDLVERFHIHKRALQRLFRQYVGVGPKWVIRRYRLQEAAERLAEDPGADWAQLALELGYWDQAHFIKDFKAAVGRTPGEYVRRVG